MSWIGTGVSVAGGIMGMAGGSEDAAELKPWDSAAPFAEDVMGEAQGLYGQGAMNPLQMMGLQNLLGYWEQMAPGMIGAAQGAWGQTLDPFGQNPQMGQAWDVAQGMAGGAENPYAQQLMDMTSQQMTQQFNEGILPGIQQGAIGAGGLGGSRQGIAEGLAAERAQRALGDQQNQLASNFYGQNLNQQQAGMGAMNNLLNTGMAQQQFGIGGLGQMLNAGATPAQQQYNVGGIYQQAPWDALNNYHSIIQPYGSPAGVPQQGNMMSGIGGQLVELGLGGIGQTLFPGK